MSGSGRTGPTGQRNRSDLPDRSNRSRDRWTGLTGDAVAGSNSAKKDDLIVSAEAQDWRVPLMSYLRDPGRGAERNIRRLAFKYVLIDDELYRRTAKDLLLKCLDSDQARIAMVRFMKVFVVLINRLLR